MKDKIIYFAAGVILILLGLFVNWAAVRDGHWAFTKLVSHDSATFVLTATSYHQGLGLPYKDYWEYRPPGFFLLVDAWSQLFGTKMISFRIFETFFRFLTGIGILYLFYALFPPFPAFVSSVLLLFTIFSPVFGRWLFPESPAIFFSLLGLIILVRDSHKYRFLFLSALFFSMATQLKDTFSGSLLTLTVPLLVLWTINFKALIKGLISSFLGFLIPVFISFLYLVNLGLLSEYAEVLKYKSSLYNGLIWNDIFFFLGRYYHALRYFKEGVTYFHYHLLIILGILLIPGIFLFFIENIKIKSQKISSKVIKVKIEAFSVLLTNFRLKMFLVVVYALGSYIGPSVMFTFSPHYYYPTIIPTYLLWTVITFVFYKIICRIFLWLKHDLVFFLILLFLLFPCDWILSQYPDNINGPKNLIERVRENIFAPDMETPVENYIASKTKPEECILSVYGWGSGETYLHSGRKPCTRFIIPTLVGASWQRDEYRNSILTNPPQAIVYSREGADLNVDNFEKKVIDLPLIIKACYRQDMKYTNNGRVNIKLYFPLYQQDEDLRFCLAKNTGKNSSL